MGLVEVNWQELVEIVWQGKTVQQAAVELGLTYPAILWHLNTMPEMKKFLLDVSMLADYRDKELLQHDRT